MSSKGKKTRGVTKGIGTHDIVTASNERILIQMNEDQKLPNGVQANSRFVSEIGSRTRSLAPLHVKTWKEVTLEVKDEIKKGLLHKFDVNFKEPGIAKFVEDKMNNTFRSWKGKLHKHFKKYADDIDFARAHPPTEKVFGDRDISDWEWLCDNLYTDQAYQNRCRINTINRNKKIYNHCGGSRPFTKHMEAEEQKGKNVTFIENWSLMHQHRGNNGGVWINEEAEKTGMADSEGTPLEDVIVPIPMQLDILAKELGTMKGKTIRGVGYGLRKDTFCPSVPASTSNPTNAQLMRYIVLLEERLASLEGERQPSTHDVDEEGVEDGNVDEENDEDVENDEDKDLDVL
ncbi:uncharacterized protein LOC112200977 [Rosa chinensis]|uniref:uncharacterized protein LOC112200977 n=1 Tax=Rosa chinensis TaxID=74649 RepID=UPI001AD93400|nr:uncharacterized protein LOC112200977 [Rosa chinensis]